MNVAKKRASLLALAKAPGDEVLEGVDWGTSNIELAVDIDVVETKDGWKYVSPGGAVTGVGRTLDDARRKAARAAWKALAARVADEDMARAGAMRIGFVVKLKSAWIVDHRAPGMLHGGHRVAVKWAELVRALGKPRFDELGDGEALYGWGLRGAEEAAAWLGVRVLGTEKDARAFVKTRDAVDLAVSDDDDAASVKRWLKRQMPR